MNENMLRCLGHFPADYVPPPLFLPINTTSRNFASPNTLLIETSTGVYGSIIWFGDESLLRPAHPPEDDLNDSAQIPRAVLESVLGLRASFQLMQYYPNRYSYHSYLHREPVNKSVSYGKFTTYWRADLERSALPNVCSGRPRHLLSEYSILKFRVDFWAFQERYATS
jgi:hypothetical protein